MWDLTQDINFLSSVTKKDDLGFDELDKLKAKRDELIDVVTDHAEGVSTKHLERICELPQEKTVTAHGVYWLEQHPEAQFAEEVETWDLRPLIDTAKNELERRGSAS